MPSFLLQFISCNTLKMSLHCIYCRNAQLFLYTLQEYTIPEGHLMMLSPYWSHRDPQRFPDPERFNPVSITNSISLHLFIASNYYRTVGCLVTWTRTSLLMVLWASEVDDISALEGGGSPCVMSQMPCNFANTT